MPRERDWPDGNGERDVIIPAWERKAREDFIKQAEWLRRSVEAATKASTNLRAENRRLIRENTALKKEHQAEKAIMRAGWERREKRLLLVIGLLILVVAGLAGGPELVKALLPIP